MTTVRALVNMYDHFTSDASIRENPETSPFGFEYQFVRLMVSTRVMKIVQDYLLTQNKYVTPKEFPQGAGLTRQGVSERGRGRTDHTRNTTSRNAVE